MRSAFAVFLRGFTLPFGATSGRRIVFNGDDGSIQFFDGAGNLRIQLGGATPLEEDSVQLSTGDSGEAVPAILSASIVGAGGTRTARLGVNSPHMNTGANAGATLFVRSESDDGTVAAKVTLETSDGGDLGLVELRTDKLAISEGANDVHGQATLVAGTVTVAHTGIAANSRIFLSRNTPGGTLGFLSVGAITAGVSFVINSSNGADTSTVNWLIVTPL